MRTLNEILTGIPLIPEPTPTIVELNTKIYTPSANLFVRWASKIAQDGVVGNRNRCLFRIACEGCGRGLATEFVRDVCMRHANGLGENEINQIVRSAFSKPRTANFPVMRVRTYTVPIVVPDSNRETTR